MYCLLVGFQIDREDLKPKIMSIPLAERDDLVTGDTDFSLHFIGYVILNQGMNGIEPVNGPIDLKRLDAQITSLASHVGVDPATAQIAEVHLEERFELDPDLGPANR